MRSSVLVFSLPSYLCPAIVYFGLRLLVGRVLNTSIIPTPTRFTRRGVGTIIKHRCLQPCDRVAHYRETRTDARTTIKLQQGITI
ncbi:hypothetical protein BDM02DRAFT_3024871 [Thelephora ganbajun]|uniref:Uncharacterized protein n=1 Tax=Thelephora ganbajun TaxID=370292 RepID=A0ACB6ZAA9_THEGA|nr:hypothetical protein BDM02DRAFT_3024871 [Thelephora ganbajun]